MLEVSANDCIVDANFNDQYWNCTVLGMKSSGWARAGARVGVQPEIGLALGEDFCNTISNGWVLAWCPQLADLRVWTHSGVRL